MADTGIAALALSQSYAQFQTYMPRLADVRRADPAHDVDMVGDVRVGEIAALVGSLGVGVIIASITGDPLPVYVSLSSSLILIVMYELVLRSHGAMEKAV